jgi:hypothetical protein
MGKVRKPSNSSTHRLEGNATVGREGEPLNAVVTTIHWNYFCNLSGGEINYTESSIFNILYLFQSQFLNFNL